MQKILLGLYGISDTGKSSTIKLAYKKFGELHPKATHTDVETDTDIETHADIEKKWKSADILVRVKVGKISVGFSSAGDDPEDVKYNLRKLRENNCDIIVCATRTKGKVITEVFMHEDNAQYLRFWMTTCIFQYAVEYPHETQQLQPEERQYQKEQQENHNNIVATLIVDFINDRMA